MILATNANSYPLSVTSEMPTLDANSLCLHALFEAQAVRTPLATAIRWGETQISYADLNARANQVAHYLQKRGVGGIAGTDKLVGLCLERSVEMIIALLAIMKAGGCYVPLDPDYPPERLTLMAQSAPLGGLLTTQLLLARLPALAQAAPMHAILCLDQAWSLIDQESTQNPALTQHDDSLLYLLFTSGSTGTPKGVAMPHRALVNLLQWQQRQLPTAVEERTLQFTPLSFDVATQEIFATLCFGGTLVLVADGVRRNPQALWQLLETERIERLFLPFVALQQLAEAAHGKRPAALHTVITAGEQLQITPAIAQFFAEPGCTLHNHYGPTESHVVTAYTLPENVQQWPALPPIGRPVDNVQIYILTEHIYSSSSRRPHEQGSVRCASDDEQMQETPMGEPGELYIGGVCLAHGYYGRPDMTEARFVPNPFGPGKLYKTGDLARFLPDGNLEYLGRSDHQVKIRGFRVELGEIEVVLARHPQVRAAVVILREDTPGLKRLVAYVVLEETPALDLATTWHELRAYLSAKLPEYMIPALFVRLESLPLTPSGKVARRALPKPEAKRPELKTPLRLPRNATETRLAATWQALLEVDVVGIDDNFFELGGTSLLLTQLYTQLTTDFPTLAIVDLLQYPTIHTLAEHLQDRNTANMTKGPTRQLPSRRLDRQAAALERREQRLRHRVV